MWLGFVGCGTGQVNIPKKPQAEVNTLFSGYDTDKFNVINIPKNCKIIAIDGGSLILENASGTQFYINAPDAQVHSPTKFVADMPELW